METGFAKEIAEHFGMTELEGKQIFIASREAIENLGEFIAFLLANGKGRTVIDYDPSYPYLAFKVFYT